jgi:GT2 family glycosyltransferase
MTHNYPDVKIIQGKENGGYSKAYNEAISRINEKYAVLLNNDIKVFPDWIEPLVAVAEKDNRIGALQPKLVWFHDTKHFEYAGSAGGMMDKFGYPFCRGRMFFNIEDDNGQYNNECDIFWASGAALFIRTEIFKKCGGLDETFVHHMEEIDMCWRIHLLGYSIRSIPDSIVAHYGGATITDESFKKMYWNHRNSIFMLMKNYELSNLIPKLFVHVMLDYVALAQSIVTLKPTRAFAITKAHIWIVFKLRLILRKRHEVQMMRRVDDTTILKKLFPRSVVIQFFIKRRTTYSQLIQTI